MHRDYLYWIWLSLRFPAGTGGFTEVLERFGDPYAAYAASERDLVSCLGSDSPALRRLLDKDLKEAHRIYDFCVSRDILILTYGDIAYPARLKTIQNPPILLYYVGTLPAFNRKLCIGVVGTRKMSEYGKRMAYKISYELASAGAVVVSGMALGCDAVAAAGAIGAEGTTVAVLGSGIDVVYPRQHLTLMEEIKQHGVVMTEYPPGTPPSGRHFPVRNRIISGLCQGTLAVEGDLKSGAMLTVGHAVKQGRKVFALPGNVGESNSEGTNELIRNGATVTISAGDILDSFELTDRDLIDFEGYKRAKYRSELSESVLLRLGITARIRESANDDGAEPFPNVPMPIGKRRTPADVLNVRESRSGTRKKGSIKSQTDAAEEPPKAAAAVTSSDKSAESSTAKKTESRAGDESEKILASLSERDRRVFCEMPLDRAISIDRLGSLGLSIGDIMTALTILEIRGLVISLPGGMYLKK